MAWKFAAVLGLGLAVVFVASTVKAVADDDADTALVNRPPITAEIEAQLGEDRDTSAASPSTDLPTAPEDPSDAAPPEADADPGAAAPVESPTTPSAPAATDNAAAPAPESAATPMSPAAPLPNPDRRNRVVLLVFGLVVLVLALLGVIAAQVYASAKRRELHRKHRHALAHAHDSHPTNRPDPAADALGNLTHPPR